jgi:hypothetical protein
MAHLFASLGLVQAHALLASFPDQSSPCGRMPFPLCAQRPSLSAPGRARGALLRPNATSPRHAIPVPARVALCMAAPLRPSAPTAAIAGGGSPLRAQRPRHSPSIPPPLGQVHCLSPAPGASLAGRAIAAPALAPHRPPPSSPRLSITTAGGPPGATSSRPCRAGPPPRGAAPCTPLLQSAGAGGGPRRLPSTHFLSSAPPRRALAGPAPRGMRRAPSAAAAAPGGPQPDFFGPERCPTAGATPPVAAAPARWASPPSG